MNNFIKALKIFSSKLKDDKKRTIIFVLTFAGIILLVISSAGQNDTSEEEKEANELVSFSESDYTLVLEQKLENMVSSVYGAGRTKVIVTLECDYETVYAKDGSYSQKEGASDEENKYIIIDSDKTEQGLVLKTVTPRVRGVAVLCEGGDSPYVESAVCEMLEALLDIGSNHISVSKIQ